VCWQEDLEGNHLKVSFGCLRGFYLGGGVFSAMTVEEIFGVWSFASYFLTRQRTEYDLPSLRIKSCLIYSE
jgi:hypothetical protein